MKTTVEIAPSLLEEAKREATREGTTLRAVIEEGLRRVLADRRRVRQPYRLPDTTVGGKGLQPAVRESGWAGMRQHVYEGRGE